MWVESRKYILYNVVHGHWQYKTNFYPCCPTGKSEGCQGSYVPPVKQDCTVQHQHQRAHAHTTYTHAHNTQPLFLQVKAQQKDQLGCASIRAGFCHAVSIMSTGDAQEAHKFQHVNRRCTRSITNLYGYQHHVNRRCKRSIKIPKDIASSLCTQLMQKIKFMTPCFVRLFSAEKTVVHPTPCLHPPCTECHRTLRARLQSKSQSVVPVLAVLMGKARIKEQKKTKGVCSSARACGSCARQSKVGIKEPRKEKRRPCRQKAACNKEMFPNQQGSEDPNNRAENQLAIGVEGHGAC
eukprot:1159571-Pelagomonas_calceolata.AAC.12